MSVHQLHFLLDLASDALRGCGWETFGPSFSEEQGSARKFLQGRWYVRVRTVLHQSDVPAAWFWPLPEVLAEAIDGAGGSTTIFRSFRVLARHAPGDVTVEQALEDMVPWYRAILYGRHTARIIVHSGHPQEEQSTMIVCPTSSTLQSLAFAVTAAPLDGFPGALVITQSFGLPSGADPHNAAATMPGITSAGTMLRMARCPCIQQTQQMIDTYYMTLTVKKCSAGSPLLPRSRHASYQRREDWSRLSYDEFELTRYLQCFLNVIGLSHILVFGNMHGQRIAPYMALVSRQQWESASTILANWFRLAGVAYRVHTGAASAPKIVEAQRAKFVEPCLPAPGPPSRMSFAGPANDTLVAHDFLRPPIEPGLTWL